MSSSPPETRLEDYAVVLRLPGRDQLPRILLGGQAVNAWALRFVDDEPALREYLPFTSKDLDLLGEHIDLDLLAAATGFRQNAAQRKIFIPSAGYLEMPLPNGTTAKVEILKRLFRITTQEIVESALHVQYNALQLRVIHPITLLRSKLENAVHLAQGKRQDVKHLKMMICCVRAFLREKMADVDAGRMVDRQCIALLEEMLQVTVTYTATTATRQYGIQWIDTLPLKELRASENPRLRNFAAKRLPQWQAQTRR